MAVLQDNIGNGIVALLDALPFTTYIDGATYGFTFDTLQTNRGLVRPLDSPSDPEQVYENILQNIGNTPIVKLERVVDAKGVNVLAKLEGFNPCSSVKDRIALSMIEDAERTGRLKKGRKNTGLS